MACEEVNSKRAYEQQEYSKKEYANKSDVIPLPTFPSGQYVFERVLLAKRNSASFQPCHQCHPSMRMHQSPIIQS